MQDTYLVGDVCSEICTCVENQAFLQSHVSQFLGIWILFGLFLVCAAILSMSKVIIHSFVLVHHTQAPRVEQNEIKTGPKPA